MEAPAYTRNGEVFMRENIPEKLRGMIAPHEGTHVMKQVSFRPYLDFIDRTPDMMDVGSDSFARLVEYIARERHVDPFDLSEKDYVNLYDEINATLYGHIASGKVTSRIREFLEEALKDYDAYYSELASIHEQFREWNKNGRPAIEQTTAQEIETKTEEAVQEQPRGSNFVIPESGLKLPSGKKARYKANVQAIKTLRTIMAEGRLATPEEQTILSKYVGWGGLSSAFDELNADWAKEYKELKKLLSDSEYRAAKSSTQNAHYTDVGVIRAMYAGLEKLGFTGGRLLEPSAGIGHFAGAMPQSLLPGVRSWTMVELDEITGNIARYLYPNADVRVQGFEEAKIPDNYMDMAISNVPFGRYGIADKARRSGHRWPDRLALSVFLRPFQPGKRTTEPFSSARIQAFISAACNGLHGGQPCGIRWSRKGSGI